MNGDGDTRLSRQLHISMLYVSLFLVVFKYKFKKSNKEEEFQYKINTKSKCESHAMRKKICAICVPMGK